MFNMKFMLTNFFDKIPKNIKNSLYSSVLEVCIVHPLDVYKTLYQQNPKYKFNNFIKTDFRFKYRGFLTRSTGIIPMRTTFWASQDFAEKKFKKYPLELFNYFLILGRSYGRNNSGRWALAGEKKRIIKSWQL